MTRKLMIAALSFAVGAPVAAFDTDAQARSRRHASHVHHYDFLAAQDWRGGWPSDPSYRARREPRMRGRHAFEGTALYRMIASHAAANGVPLELARRVVARESGGNPRAVSKGNYGLMQIRLGTARAMGYAGSAAGLLDPNTNLAYAMKYLAGAHRAAGGNHGRAVALYARGYYHEAKRQGWSVYQPAGSGAEGRRAFAWASPQGHRRASSNGDWSGWNGGWSDRSWRRGKRVMWNDPSRSNASWNGPVWNGPSWNDPSWGWRNDASRNGGAWSRSHRKKRS